MRHLGEAAQPEFLQIVLGGMAGVGREFPGLATGAGLDGAEDRDELRRVVLLGAGGAEPVNLVGRAPDYRFVCVDGWPGSVHYEFLHRKSRRELGAELHFESDVVRPLSNAVRDARLRPVEDLPGLVWDQKWSVGRGRLRVVFKDDEAPEVVARTMVALIRKTRAIVDKALRGAPRDPA